MCSSWPVPWGPWVLSPDPVRDAAGPGQDPGTCCFEAGGTPAGASHAVMCEVASGTPGMWQTGSWDRQLQNWVASLSDKDISQELKSWGWN